MVKETVLHEVYRSPWQCVHGYVACIVKFSDGSKKTVLQHRELMEKVLGRTLLPDEIVHHRDGNKSNNEVGNLEVMKRSPHVIAHRNEKPAELFKFICPVCKKLSVKLARNVRHNQIVGKFNGPFCGRSCAGVFTATTAWKRKKGLL